MKKKIVYIDGWFLKPPLRGVGKYIQNIITSIPRTQNEIEYVLLIPSADIVIKSLPSFLKINLIPCKFILIWYEFIVPKTLRKDNSYIFFPSGICGITNTIPKKKVFSTIHDISALLPFNLSPMSFKLRQILGRLYRYLSFYILIRKSNIIFTVSETAKRDIKNLLSKKNINVPFIMAVNNASEINISKINKKNKNFICITGDSRQKNYKIIINALDYIDESVLKDWKIFLIGLNENKSIFHPSGAEIKIKKYLNSYEIKKLMMKSYCLIFPSLYESFGIPLVDAMRTGCYIVASNQGATKEICCENALYFNPNSAKDLSINILKVISKYPIQPLINKDNLAFQQTWEKTSKEIFDKIVKMIIMN